MSNRPVSIGRLGAVLGALALAVAACGGAAAPSTSPGGGGATPSPAASIAIDLPSIEIPSFEADVDLEAQLPSTFCDQPTQKFSFTGAEFVANDEAFAGVVAALGRSASDVSVAGAGVAGPECAGINLIAFRVKGADGGRFEELFINAQEADSGSRPTRSNVAGKDVWIVIDSGGTTSYIYFKGDTVFGVTAESQGDAAKGLAVMP
jgi:hypothetical protein